MRRRRRVSILVCAHHSSLIWRFLCHWIHFVVKWGRKWRQPPFFLHQSPFKAKKIILATISRFFIPNSRRGNEFERTRDRSNTIGNSFLSSFHLIHPHNSFFRSIYESSWNCDFDEEQKLKLNLKGLEYCITSIKIETMFTIPCKRRDASRKFV